MNLIGIGAGLGGLLKGYEQAGQFVQQQQMNNLRMQQFRQQQQEQQQLNQLLDAPGMFGQLSQAGGQMPAIGTGMAGGGVDPSQLPNTSMMGPQAATPMPGQPSVSRQPAMAPTPMPSPDRYGSIPETAGFNDRPRDAARAFDVTQTPQYRDWQRLRAQPAPEVPDADQPPPVGTWEDYQKTHPIQQPTSGGLAPGFQRGPEGDITQNGRPPDTYLGGNTPAWKTSGGAGSTLDLIERDESGGRNIMQTAYSGEGINPSTGTHTAPSTAQGYYQITNSTWREAAPQAGVDISQYPTAMSAPKEVQRQVAAHLLKTQGTAPWAPYNAKLRADLGQGGGEDTLAASAPPQAQRQAQTVAQNSLWNIPPQMYGRMQLQTAAQMIEKAAPNAPGHIKFLALERMQKLLAPDAQQQFDVWKMQAQEAFQHNERVLQQDFEMRKAQQTGGTVYVDPERGPLSIKGGVATPVIGPDGQPLTGSLARPGAVGGKAQASRNVEVTDADGKVIFKGAAHKGADGEWISDKDQKPVPIPDDGNIKLSSAGGAGRQAETAVQRLILAGNEIPRAMENLVDLPTTATAGIFGGLQAERGADLSDAAKRSLANKLTPEDAQSVLVSFQGVSRALAMIEAAGAAQGLVGLTQRADVLMPKAGDTTLTILRKYAEIRQLMEQGIETVSKSSAVNDQQQKLMTKMLDQIKKAVPWTVPDVNALQRKPGAETIKAFAKRVGAGSPPPDAVGGEPTATGPNGEKMKFNGTEWVPVTGQ